MIHPRERSFEVSATGGAARRTTAGVLAFWWAVLLALAYLIGRIVTDASWSWDQSAVEHLRGAGGQPLLSVMRAVTALGSPRVLDAVFVAALAGLLMTRRLRDALFLALASPGSVLLGQSIKPLVARPRPAGPHLTHAAGFSWPSGHASSSLALYGALLLIGLSTPPLRRPWLACCACVITGMGVALIGLSRVYLGVHYPTDVAAAWLLVGTWLLVTSRLLKRRTGLGDATGRAVSHFHLRRSAYADPVIGS